MSNITQAERNAVEFGHHVGAPGWFNGFLVACSVNSDRSNPSSAKLSIRDFGRNSRQTDSIVKAYLMAWNAAAHDGYVATAEELSPNDAKEGLDFDPNTHTAELWQEYFDAAMAPKRERDLTYNRERRKPTKEQVAYAIKSDPQVEKVARETVVQQEISRDAQRRATADRNVTGKAKDGSLSRREEDATDSHFDSLIIKLRAMHRYGQEALGLALDIQGFQQESKRAVVIDHVKDLHMLLNVIQEAAEGRSIDDEISALLGEEHS